MPSKALDKIKKCLALAESSNTHEAATALRHARIIADKHNIDLGAIHIAHYNLDLGDSHTRPAEWKMRLSLVCANAFQCIALFSYGDGQRVQFIGEGQFPQWASYAFEILERQLKKARRDYTSTLKRCRIQTKRRRGNIFATSWISAVEELVADFAKLTSEQEQRLTNYLQKNNANLVQGKLESNKASKRDFSAHLSGLAAGAHAKLHAPLAANPVLKNLRLTQQLNLGGVL